MNWTFAPPQLSLAPRPVRDELISSWLLRVAATNDVSLQELLQGFAEQYPQVLAPFDLLDCSVPTSASEALARFGRIPLRTLRQLDLQYRADGLNPASLLRFRSSPGRRARRHAQRVGYAYCSRCLAEQAVPHIRWDWCFPCVVRCPIHRIVLLDGCPSCGEPDPLTFSPSVSRHLCWSCGGCLTFDGPQTAANSMDHCIDAAQNAYLAALVKVDPDARLFGRVADQSFRKFVDDILTVLTRSLNKSPRSHDTSMTGGIPRGDLVKIVAELVWNSEPSRRTCQQQSRCAFSLRVWGILLKVIPVCEEEFIERVSLHWPVPLRRQFVTALSYWQRKRWPGSPFQGHTLSTRFKRIALSAVSDLSATNRTRKRKFHI